MLTDTPMPIALERAMRAALELAESAIGLSEPNPRVGCLLLDPQLNCIGQGHTQAVGGAHAEVMALRDAMANGASVQGATAIVTLEPCSHHGRTPPCCDALIDAGISRVIVAVADPNPQVAGQGMARLRAAGIEVVLAQAGHADASRELNIGFFSRMQRGRPFVRLKIAASLDGRTALPDGRSQWITGEPARTDGHAWRQRAGAVLTGIGTVRDDNPRLDVRLVPTQRQPLRVVIDSRLEIDAAARVLQAPGEVLLVSADPAAARADLGHLETLCLPNPHGKVDLAQLLYELARRGINELHIEAGHKLNGSWLAAGLVDELLLYQAPFLIGTGPGLAHLPALPALTDAQRWRRVDCTPIGDDLRLRFRPA